MIRVERYVIVTGTTENLPRALTPWLVVEADGRFHPQTSVATTRWTGRVTIGRRGFGVDNGEDFPIHVVATSGRTNDSFRKYLDEQEALPQQKRWHGLALPAAARVLATRVVRRDDQAATLVKLRGTYDEFRARPPQPTFGTIEIKGTHSRRPVTLSAIDKAGEVEWTGSITVNSQTGEITGQYKNTKNQGEGTLQVTQDRDEISITGQGKAAGAKPFFMQRGDGDLDNRCDDHAARNPISRPRTLWDTQSVSFTSPIREAPRLCRGGSRSLTDPGVHRGNSNREPPSARKGDFTRWTNTRV